jgi:HTH-type transcriptional regulator, competence development regulator
VTVEFNKDRNWLGKRAVQEDQHFISAGGLISRVGLTQQVDEPGASGLEVTQLAFVRLLQLARRERHLSLEQLAEEADVDLVEVLNIEMLRSFRPNSRTVYQLASFFELPAGKLMMLAGLVQIRDAGLQEASLRFFLRSEPIEGLSPEETVALEEFAKFLGQE